MNFSTLASYIPSYRVVGSVRRSGVGFTVKQLLYMSGDDRTSKWTDPTEPSWGRLDHLQIDLTGMLFICK